MRLRAASAARTVRAATLSAVGTGLIAVGCGASPALAAAAPRGTLSDHEFTVLSAAQLSLKSALGDKGPKWEAAARNACLAVTFGASTPLLATQKTDCLGSLQLEVALAAFPAADAKCTKRGPTGKIFCLAPLYKALARDAANAYTVDARARSAILRRGFTGACLAVLASTPKELGNERELAAATKTLSGDMYLLVNISDGQAPPSKLPKGRIDADAKAFEHDVDLVLRDNSPDDLTACPHQAN